MREHHILSITADNGTEFSRLAEVSLRNISTMHIPTLHGRGERMKITIIDLGMVTKGTKKQPERSRFYRKLD